MDESRRARVAFTKTMLRQQGFELGEYTPWPDHPGDGLVITGFGAGITMAFADHLARLYPHTPLLVTETPGSMPFEKRCLVMDYLSACYPCVFLLWSSVRPLGDYIDFLKRRAWCPPAAWVYLKGLGDECVEEWLSCGARLIEQPWRDAPLGNLTPTQTSQPWVLLQPETTHVQPSPVP